MSVLTDHRQSTAGMTSGTMYEKMTYTTSLISWPVKMRNENITKRTTKHAKSSTLNTSALIRSVLWLEVLFLLMRQLSFVP